MGIARADTGMQHLRPAGEPKSLLAAPVPHGSTAFALLSGESHQQEAAIQHLRVKATFQGNLSFTCSGWAFWKPPDSPKMNCCTGLGKTSTALGSTRTTQPLPFVTQQNLPILSLEQDCILLSKNQEKKETVYGERISVRN